MTTEDILDIAKRRGNEEALKVARRCKDKKLIRMMQERINPPKRTYEGSGAGIAHLSFMQPVDLYR